MFNSLSIIVSLSLGYVRPLSARVLTATGNVFIIVTYICENFNRIYMVFNFSIEKYPFQEKESEKRWKGDGFAMKKWLESIDFPPIYAIIELWNKKAK